jgi:RHS repeat-associated protein
VDVGVGNPINLVNGNKHLQEVDMPALPGVLGLELVRHYNSASAGVQGPPGSVGWGWRFSYEATLSDSGGGRVLVRQADGTQWAFAAVAPAAATLGRARLHTGPAGEVWAEPNGTGWHHRWRWTRGPHAGRELRFDTQGRLVQVTAATGEWLAILYDPLGRLAQVTDPQGRSLFFHPVPAAAGARPTRFAGVGAVDTPMGRYTYRHSVPEGGAGLAARLDGVDLPTHTAPGHAWSNRPVTTSATSRRYHHEDPRWPTHLTGISLHGTGSDGVPVDARLSTYAYNPQGRAHLSTLGSGPSVAGAGDGAATAPQVRLAWPQPGWVWMTTAEGAQTVYRTTYLGGHVRVLEARGAGCPSCGPVNRRYRYDVAGRLLSVSELAPVLVSPGRPVPIARVVGETRWVRDGLGRVVRVEQTQVGQHQPGVLWQAVYGDPRWPDHPTRVSRPSVQPGLWQHTDWVYNGHAQVLRVAETGHSPLDTTPLVRATAYRYQQVNGRSVLVAVDGPLPNGPLGDNRDSDVTGIAWDPLGHAPTSLSRPGRAPAHMTYGAGSGLLQSVATPDGVRTDWAYDPQQQPVHTRTQAPGWQAALWHGYHRNAFGWVTTWQEQAPGDAVPRATRRAAYDTQGRLLWQAGALGLARVYRYGPDGGLAAVQQHSAAMSRAVLPEAAAPHPVSGRVATPQTDLDDWGRPVRTRSADTGLVTRVFDAADRLVAMTDAMGRTARYQWDLQNRLVEQTTGSHGEPPVSTRWRYQGDRLVALDHPDQSERYQHDPRGLRWSRTVALPGASGVVTVHSQYRHDEAGRLASVRLPSGAWLRYQRNGQGQVVAVHLNPVDSPGLQRWAREQVVVHGLARDLVGLRRVVAGNGVETLHQRSPQAGLARVVHRRLPAPLAATAWGWGSAHASTPDPAPPPPDPGQPPGALGWPADPQALWDQRYLWDNAGNLVHQQQKAGELAWSTHAYDGDNRWVASVESPPADRGREPTLWRQAYGADGRRVLDQTTTMGPWDLDTNTRHHRFQSGTHRLLGAAAAPVYGADGLPTTWGGKALRWDALGRLVAVDRAGVAVARYRYDHRGLRHTQTTPQGTTHSVYSEDRSLLAELNAQGRITRQYLQLAGLPLAIWDSPEGLPTSPLGREPMAQLWADLQAVWRSWWGGPVPLTWVHLNHLEAPVLATNAQGRVVWQAHHRPNGVAEVTRADLPIHLLGPGQHTDAATGWVYNRQRYLDPALGQYLSPDPLGTPDGPNPYAHVGHNPLRYVDPDGLVLFSFDGTNNSLASQTNVQLFARHYADYSAYDQAAQIDWRRYYTPGPGTSPEDWLDGQVVGGLVAPRLRGIVDVQLGRFNKYVQDRMAWEVDAAARSGRAYSIGQPLEIYLDVVGFSRGAAAAREFLNRVDDLSRQGYYRWATGGQCVRVIPRFAGLFDTVLSANTDFNMRMGIPESVRYVAHAVAVNEHRALFPLESIEDRYGAPGSDANRVERGFVGAHGDIGGGYTVQDGSDLSDVALQWMWQQAAAQGVQMRALDAPLQVVSHPVVHDERRAVLWRTLLQMQPTPELADRRVVYRAAPDRPVPGALQRAAPTVGLDHQDSLGLLTFRNLGLADQFNTQVADVNLPAYRAWLAQHHAWRP